MWVYLIGMDGHCLNVFHVRTGRHIPPYSFGTIEKPQTKQTIQRDHFFFQISISNLGSDHFFPTVYYERTNKRTNERVNVYEYQFTAEQTWQRTSPTQLWMPPIGWNRNRGRGPLPLFISETILLGSTDIFYNVSW